jgi:hypothetical protein
LKRLDDG